MWQLLYFFRYSFLKRWNRCSQKGTYKKYSCTRIVMSQLDILKLRCHTARIHTYKLETKHSTWRVKELTQIKTRFLKYYPQVLVKNTHWKSTQVTFMSFVHSRRLLLYERFSQYYKLCVLVLSLLFFVCSSTIKKILICILVQNVIW